MFKTTIEVNGMMCGMCESHVNDAVRNAMTVKKVTSSRGKRETVVLTDDEPDADALRAVISATGRRDQNRAVREKGIFRKITKGSRRAPFYMAIIRFIRTVRACRDIRSVPDCRMYSSCRNRTACCRF